MRGRENWVSHCTSVLSREAVYPLYAIVAVSDLRLGTTKPVCAPGCRTGFHAHQRTREGYGRVTATHTNVKAPSKRGFWMARDGIEPPTRGFSGRQYYPRNRHSRTPNSIR
jgi:hypothetical protein